MIGGVTRAFNETVTLVGDSARPLRLPSGARPPIPNMTSNSINDRILSPARERTGLLAIGLLAVALRLVRLGSRDYWHDEVHNLVKAAHLKDVILHGELVSNHPPLFPILVWVWRALGLGGNEWTMRLLPAVLGALTVIALYYLGKTIFGARVGLVSAFILAISPFHLLHSQDLKEYIVLPLMTCLAVAFLYRATGANRRLDWAAYAVFAALMCYSELFAGPLLVAVNLWFLTQIRGRRDRIVPWVIANVTGAALFLPQLAIMLQKANNIMIQAEGWWIKEPTLLSVVFYLKTIAFGYGAVEPYYKIALVVFCLLVAAGGAWALRCQWRGALLLAVWFVLPVAIVYAISISPFSQSIFLYRAMLPYAIPLYVFVAYAVVQARPRVLTLSAFAIYVALAAVGMYTRYADIYHPQQWPHRPGTHPPREYRAATDHILDNLEDGDVILHATSASWFSMFWYGLKDKPSHFATQSASFAEHIMRSNPRNNEREDLKGVNPTEVARLVEGRQRMWYVFSEWERGYLKGPPHNPGNAAQVWRWLDTHALEIGHWYYDGIELLLYENVPSISPIEYRRDEDDGYRAKLFRKGQFESPYVKVMPDYELIYTPPEERRGPLMIRFDDERETENGRASAFVVENRSDRDIDCRIECMTSDVLLIPARWPEQNVASDVWHVYPMIRTGVPGAIYELPVATALVHTPGRHTLEGLAHIKQGEYTSHVRILRGAPPPLPQLSLVAGGTNLLDPTLWRAPEGFDWHWLPGAPATVPSPPVAVNLSAEKATHQEFARVDLAYVAFNQGNRDDITTDWPGNVTIPAHSSRTWKLETGTGDPRIDVWVYDTAPDGRAYHIYHDTTAASKH